MFVLLKFDILLSESITLLLAFCDEDAKVGEISEILKLFAVFFLLHIVFLGFLGWFQPFFSCCVACLAELFLDPMVGFSYTIVSIGYFFVKKILIFKVKVSRLNLNCYFCRNNFKLNSLCRHQYK